MAEIEIINGPLSIYWAPVGEAYPAINVAPVGNWLLVGTSGPHNYSEDGVVIATDKSIEYFRALASGYPRKSFLTEADITVTVNVADMTLAELRLALNQNTVTVGAIDDSIEMDVGLDPTEIAILIRGIGKSPQLAGGNLQYELQRVVEEGSQEYGYVKGEPAMSELVFRVIYDEGNPNPAGRLVVQTV